MIDPFSTAQLGRTGVRVTRLGLGTAPLGGWPEPISDEQAAATVRRAWDAGVRYFDTAPFYGWGRSEGHIARGLAGVDRGQFVLSTKVGRLLVPGADRDPFYLGGPDLHAEFDFSPGGVTRSLASSRERLGFDRIDVALIHDPDEHHAEALAAFAALAKLRADGVIGAIGAGMNFAAPLAQFAREADFDCFLLAGRYTLFEQHSLDDLMPAAVERNISIIAGGVYNSGLLANPRPGTYYDYAPAGEAVVRQAQRLEATCREFDVPLRAAAIQFPLAHPAVATVAVGARTPDEVEDNVRMLRIDIPAELWTALKDQDLVRPDAPTP